MLKKRRILRKVTNFEIEGDREPYVKIKIKEQTFLAYCDVGSMMSTIPKMVFLIL